MGKFETISAVGLKSYTLFSKSSFNTVLALDKDLPMYSLYGEGKDISVEIYLDSPNNLLQSAGILLSKVIEEGKAYFKVEREEYLPERKFMVKDRKIFVHPIGMKDSVSDHTLFLIDGITSMFFTKFHIDLENILKTIVPKLEIESRREKFKILSGKGFKAEMIYERIGVKNYDTKRKNEFLMLNIEQTSNKLKLDEFNDFTSKLEKYCKEVMLTKDTRYEIAKKITSTSTPKNKRLKGRRI